MVEARVEALIRTQHGVISRRQALEAGMSSQQIQRRLASETWNRTFRGVYQHRLFRPTWHSGLAAGCLAVDGLAAARTGAVLHGLECYRKGGRHVLVPRGRRRRSRHVPGIFVHETNDFHLAAPKVVNGIPCTGLLRTVFDVASASTDRQLAAAIDALVRDGRVTFEQLYDVLAKHGGQGRSGCHRLRQVLDERWGEKRMPLSTWSRLVADLLVAHGLPKPVLEYWVTGPDGELIAQVDLGYPDYTAAIELDSLRWHLDRESFQTDRSRANDLIVVGWTPLRFTWDDWLSRPRQLCATVEAVLRKNGWPGRKPTK